MSCQQNDLSEDRCYEKFIDMYYHDDSFNDFIKEEFIDCKFSNDEREFLRGHKNWEEVEDPWLARIFDILWNWDAEGMHHKPRTTTLNYHEWKIDQEKKRV
jgi:hypothetical protein